MRPIGGVVVRLGALAAILAMPAPAAAVVRLSDTGEVHALAVSERGAAVALVDSGDAGQPFGLMRSSGGTAADLGTLGRHGAEYPDLVAGPDGAAYVSWAVPISGGIGVTVLRAPPEGGTGDAVGQVVATGPGRLAAAADGSLLVAHPDRDGNAALTRLVEPSERGTQERAAATQQPQPLSSSAPERRHLPLDAVAGEHGPLVLDLVQRRGQTELRVLGPGAPAAAVMTLPALRHVPARLAVGAGRVAVGYLVSGRAYLAVARLGGSWSRRRLGRGGAAGPPAPMLRHGELLAVYTQRVGRQREVFLLDSTGTERITRTAGSERDPLAAVGPDGSAYLAWTRREPRRGPTRALLERLQ